jgi:hypothetical protein
MVGARAASDSREGEPGWGAPLEVVKSFGSPSLSGRAPDRPIVRGYVAFAPSSLRLYPACTTYPLTRVQTACEGGSGERSPALTPLDQQPARRTLPGDDLAPTATSRAF